MIHDEPTSGSQLTIVCYVVLTDNYKCSKRRNVLPFSKVRVCFQDSVAPILGLSLNSSISKISEISRYRSKTIEEHINMFDSLPEPILIVFSTSD